MVPSARSNVFGVPALNAATSSSGVCGRPSALGNVSRGELVPVWAGAAPRSVVALLEALLSFVEDRETTIAKMRRTAAPAPRPA